MVVVAASNYSYSANKEPERGNFLTEPLDAACRHLAASGYGDLYLLPGAFSAADPAEQLPLGSEAFTGARLDAARDAIAAAGLRTCAVLVPDAPEGEGGAARYRRVIEQASALGARWLIDFGPGVGEEAAYIQMMRAVAPDAAACGIGISMKLHHPFDSGKSAFDELVRVHDAVSHPAFGLCLDPGNLAWFPYYQSLEAAGGQPPHKLPAAALTAAAHRFTTVIVKDCVVNPAPNPMTQPGQGVVDLPDMMAILSESGFDGPLLIEKLPGKSLAELDGNMAAALDFCQALPSAPTDEPEIDPRAGSTLLPSSLPAPTLTAAQVAQFQAEGSIVLPGCVSAEQIEQWRGEFWSLCGGSSADDSTWSVAERNAAQLCNGKPHDYCWHLGCILPRVPAMIGADRLRL